MKAKSTERDCRKIAEIVEKMNSGVINKLTGKVIVLAIKIQKINFIIENEIIVEIKSAVLILLTN